jgi:hypothetical protein
MNLNRKKTGSFREDPASGLEFVTEERLNSKKSLTMKLVNYETCEP